MKISSRITDLETLLIIFEAKLNSIDVDIENTAGDATQAAVNNSQLSIDKESIIDAGNESGLINNRSDNQSTYQPDRNMNTNMNMNMAVTQTRTSAEEEEHNTDTVKPPQPPPPPPPLSQGSVLSPPALQHCYCYLRQL